MSEELSHYGVPGMKWGVRKKQKNEVRKRTPLSGREKALVGGLVGTGALLAASGGGLATLKIRNTQYKLSTAQARAWVENLNAGIKLYQDVTPEMYKRTYPDKNTYNVAQQFLRNRDLMRYILK